MGKTGAGVAIFFLSLTKIENSTRIAKQQLPVSAFASLHDQDVHRSKVPLQVFWMNIPMPSVIVMPLISLQRIQVCMEFYEDTACLHKQEGWKESSSLMKRSPFYKDAMSNTSFAYSMISGVWCCWIVLASSLHAMAVSNFAAYRNFELRPFFPLIP